jgi:hypothetical protein
MYKKYLSFINANIKNIYFLLILLGRNSFSTSLFKKNDNTQEV